MLLIKFDRKSEIIVNMLLYLHMLLPMSLTRPVRRDKLRKSTYFGRPQNREHTYKLHQIRAESNRPINT